MVLHNTAITSRSPKALARPPLVFPPSSSRSLQSFFITTLVAGPGHRARPVRGGHQLALHRQEDHPYGLLLFISLSLCLLLLLPSCLLAHPCLRRECRTASCNVNSLLIDLRNHGSSPHSPDHSYDAMIGDLYHLLTKRYAMNTFSLMGHSMVPPAAVSLQLIIYYVLYLYLYFI